jgi:hypothetical protein
MNDLMERRLKALEEEYQNGRNLLSELESREALLKSNLLRISGAIQVLREFLTEKDISASDAASEETIKSFAVAS